jgi:hypothetical protein
MNRVRNHWSREKPAGDDSGVALLKVDWDSRIHLRYALPYQPVTQEGARPSHSRVGRKAKHTVKDIPHTFSHFSTFA